MVIRLGPGAEFDLIRDFLAGLPSDGPGIRVGPGDDCAVVAGDGIAVTVDMAVEEVHFRRDWTGLDGIGYHAAAAAISDLAAVAARPIGILASVALGPGDEDGAGRDVMRGVADAAATSGARLLGGDLTRSSGPLVIDITALGEASAPVLRDGASAGDEVWVTGELGAAALAVDSWLDGRAPSAAAAEAWTRPTPRVREALWLAERGIPTAMVDLSDGLVGDAGHIAAASGVSIVIRAADIPVAASVREAVAGADRDAIRLAAAGGEDYELCFTARPGAVDAAAFRRELGVAVTKVGEVGEGEGAVVVDGRGRPMDLKAFQHWRTT